MAGAGDEVSHLLRLCDKGLDTAKLLAHVRDFPDLGFCKQRCLQSMQAWHRLTMATLAAEFPDFDLSNSFCVVSLPDPDAADGGQAPPFLHRGCEKLAQEFDFDTCTLQHERL